MGLATNHVMSRFSAFFCHPSSTLCQSNHLHLQRSFSYLPILISSTGWAVAPCLSTRLPCHHSYTCFLRLLMLNTMSHHSAESSSARPSKKKITLEMEKRGEGNSPEDDLEELDLRSTTSPHGYQIINCSPTSTAESRLHPNSISNAYTTFEDWRKEINEAIKFRLDGSMHDVVKVLLLTWQQCSQPSVQSVSQFSQSSQA